jgi:hypothetical protein
MTLRSSFSGSDLFNRAVRRILRPLVRALIAQGVTAPAFYRIVKQTYVEVAAQDLGDRATDSRINVTTGVHRRDVKEFRALDDGQDDSIAQKVSILATVIGRWMSEPAYKGDTGPIPLPRTADEGPSFDGLVRSVSRDIRPRTVLDELIRQNIVEMHEDVVHLLVMGFVGPADMDQKLHFFARNLGDHMQAAVDNLLDDAPPHLERAVFYNNLSAASIAAIEAQARRIGLEALEQINSIAAAHQSEDRTANAASHRFRFGVFFFKEDEDAEGTSDNAER